MFTNDVFNNSAKCRWPTVEVVSMQTIVRNRSIRSTAPTRWARSAAVRKRHSSARLRNNSLETLAKIRGKMRQNVFVFAGVSFCAVMCIVVNIIDFVQHGRLDSGVFTLSCILLFVATPLALVAAWDNQQKLKIRLARHERDSFI